MLLLLAENPKPNNNPSQAGRQAGKQATKQEPNYITLWAQYNAGGLAY